jgi:curved DNA-binding protein CbpA
VSLKNYYTLLGVPQAATGDEIRAAYRSLAKKYHPDKAPDNPFAAAHFSEIQEAYEVLSNPARRAAYDEERWLRGLTNRSNAAVRITPDWILQEAVRLRKHMATVDTYRMNHAALRDYVSSLLSPQHLSVLQGEADMQGRILEEIFLSVQSLRHPYAQDVADQLKRLSGHDDASWLRVRDWADSRKFEARWNVYGPVLVLVFALLICVLIWWLR